MFGMVYPNLMYCTGCERLEGGETGEHVDSFNDEPFAMLAQNFCSAM